MLASGFVSKAAWLLLLGTALAAPPPKDAADQADAAIQTTTAAAAAAAETPTATAADQTDDADVAACHNTDGPFKPFCLPKANDVIIPGTTYYITWDPTFFPASNTTLKILGFYATPSSRLSTSPTTPDHPPDDKSNPASPGGQHEAFSSDNIDSGWGFWQWRPDAQLLKRPKLKAANITLRIVALPPAGSEGGGGGGTAQWLTGPTVLLKYKDKAPPPETPGQPHKHIGEGGKYDRVRGGGGSAAGDRELYVVLPLVFGVIALFVVMTIFCNRDARRIDLGDVVRSSRRLRRLDGGSRRNAAGARGGRAARDAEESIHLMEHHGPGGQQEDDWDAGWGEHEGRGRVFERVDRKVR
ncbi:hypothetical protein VTJ49DRAFT_2990 [Mycothermus thermophilus]|uniref:Uncharacterized protein n=1 Tax=Humicola insolens TaxID=85995 RepID=A0ABR3V8I0_HUMIN